MASSRVLKARQRGSWRWRRPRQALRFAEILVWSALVRLLLLTRSIDQAVRWLDLLPRRRSGASHGVPPPEGPFRLAGACLGRSLARSQYLRIRGQPSIVVIGVRGGLATFAAHAWLDGDPVDPDFVELRRIHR